MKKELGKWLMDIAKYMTTALLISSVFSDMQDGLIFALVLLATISTLLTGLILIKDSKDEPKNN